MTTGVYAIIHKESSKIYIGGTTNIRTRWKAHINKLNRNSHENKRLQEAWNKYGPDSFDFVVIETTTKEDLLKAEQKWIDHYQSAKQSKGFNIHPTAGSGLGYKLSEEHKRKIALAGKGKKLSDEAKQKISIKAIGNKRGQGHHYCGVLTEKDVIEIKYALADGINHHEIASRYNVTYDTVHRIAIGKTWYNIKVPQGVQNKIVANLPGIGGHTRVKLSDNDVIKIKERIKNGEGNTAIAKDYNVTPSHISSIRYGRGRKRFHQRYES